MNELYRVLKPGAKATVVSPYWSSMRSIQDYTHEWPPVCEASFLYFNKNWREQNKLEHYLDASCDFDFTYGYGVSNSSFTSRSDETKAFAISHYNNVADDLQVVLTKRSTKEK
jgi:hypothetical protein